MMADDAADDERETELSSIAAIFPELVISPENRFAASINLPVTPATPFTIRPPALSDRTLPLVVLPNPQSSSRLDKADSLSTGPPNEAGGDVHLLAHLPSLQLKISLRTGYPYAK